MHTNKLISFSSISILLLSGALLNRIEASNLSQRYYVRLDGGGVLTGEYTANNQYPDLQINNLGRSWIYGGGIGLFLKDNFRLELKAIRRESMRYQYFSESVDWIDLVVGNLQNTTATLGAYYQLFHMNRSSPYIGFGGGYSKNVLYGNKRLTDLDIGRASSLENLSQTSACLFASAGTLIDLFPHCQLDISGSYVNLGKVGPVLVNRAKLSNLAVFELSIGLVFRFP